ncbi:MAG: glycine cleavage system aminomethyltransferase GcvT [Thermoplasmata archaeon]|nr:glycine cleavage system aminomethyltransferase GcvT [Thermoplasmata archaeon]
MSAATVPAEATLRQSPLAEFHRAHGGHMVPFAGWEMPLYFSGPLAEHAAVRHQVGVFDVSHMGILTVDGGDAPALLSRRTTADIARLAPGRCKYTFVLDSTGAIADDLLITRLDEGDPGGPRFVVVPNAATSARIVELLRQHRRPNTHIAAHNGKVAILAVQGPGSAALLSKVFGWSLDALSVYRARWFPAEPGGPGPGEGILGPEFPADLTDRILVSRTGYTGEAGFELFVAASRAVAVAEALVAAGALPAGLAARDSLRLEKGFLLSGQDFDRNRTPLEAGQERFVDLAHVFVGREALQQQAAKGGYLRLAGIRANDENAIPRHGTPVLSEGAVVATVTSGGLSPGLHRGIALAYLPEALTAPGTPLTLDIRGRPAAAEVVRLPFVASAARTSE